MCSSSGAGGSVSADAEDQVQHEDEDTDDVPPQPPRAMYCIIMYIICVMVVVFAHVVYVIFNYLFYSRLWQFASQVYLSLYIVDTWSHHLGTAKHTSIAMPPWSADHEIKQIMWCSRMPSGCSSNQPRYMVGLSGWSAFSGVLICCRTINHMSDVSSRASSQDIELVAAGPRQQSFELVEGVLCVYVYMYVRMHMYTHIEREMYMLCMCIYYIYREILIYNHIYIYIYICVHTCVHIYIYIHTYIHVYWSQRQAVFLGFVLWPLLSAWNTDTARIDRVSDRLHYGECQHGLQHGLMDPTPRALDSSVWPSFLNIECWIVLLFVWLVICFGMLCIPCYRCFVCL